MSAIKIYGIKNCDSMKKAINWLTERGIRYEFHDYKKTGVPRERLLEWCKLVGWKTLINTKGSTWRKLTPDQRDISSQNKAIETMMEHTSVIRRPVVEIAEGRMLVGFDPTVFESFVK